MTRGAPVRAAVAALLLGAAVACGRPGPTPVPVGTAACEHCHMTIADPRFAAELVTRTGKVFYFDDAGCLARFAGDGSVPADRIHSAWVTDFRAPGTLLSVQDAIFLRTDSVQTPMGSNLLAVPRAAGDSLRAALGGTLLDWDAVLASVRAPA